MFWILDDEGESVSVGDDVRLWAEWFEIADRTLALDRIGEVHVSTVFIGLDFNSMVEGMRPLLWESMVFGGEFDQEIRRYPSLQAAKEGHAALVRRVQMSESCVGRVTIEKNSD